MSRVTSNFRPLLTPFLGEALHLMMLALSVTCGYAQSLSFKDLNLAAYGINDSGTIVGYSFAASGNLQGTIYSYTTGAYTTLNYPNALNTILIAINNSGSILGTYGNTITPLATVLTKTLTLQGNQYFIYSNGTFSPISSNGAIPPMPGFDCSTDVVLPYRCAHFLLSSISGLNDRGEIAGFASIQTAVTQNGSTTHGFFGLPAFGVPGPTPTPVNIGTYTQVDCPNNSKPTLATLAYGINNNDAITGLCTYDNPSLSEPLFIFAGIYSTLVFPNSLLNAGFGINDSGQVAGFYQSATDGKAQGLFFDGSSAQSISHPKSTFTSLTGINNTGLIIGNSDGNGGFGFIISTPGGGTLPTPAAPVPKLFGSGAMCPVPCNSADASATITSKGKGAAGEPIDIASGNVFYETIDYSTLGQNPLALTRYYNSLTNAKGVATFAVTFGTNWRSTYDRYLQLSSSSVIAERADGQQLTFTRNSGTLQPDTDVDITLSNSGSAWSLVDSDDTVETYAAVSATEARLASITARNGYTQTLIYNTGNQLTSVADSYGRSLSFTYNAQGQTSAVATPDATTISFGYTAVGSKVNLTSATYSTSPATTVAYAYANASFPAALTGVTDENGGTYLNWAYDTSGRAVTSSQGSSAVSANLVKIAYNDTTGARTITNPLGVQDTYSSTTLQGVPKVTLVQRAATSGIAAATRKFTYDANGYMASRTDWNGNLTVYVNDAHGQPTTITEGQGTPAARVTTITYDSSFVHLPQQIVTPGLTTSFTYDGNGEVLNKILTDTTAQTVPYATAAQARTWTYSWANSLLASVQGPRTDVQQLTKFSYDASGALTATTNALGQTTKITQHLPGGLPQTVVDPNGVATNLTYDARQRLLSSAVTTSRGVLTTKYTYDAAGNLVTMTLPDGSALTNSFDTAHRLTGVTDLLKQSIAYGLDALGDRLSTIAADASSKPQRQHYGTFDALGRQTQDIGGASQTTQFTYDPNGNTQSVADPLGHVTGQTFDALNRPVSATDAAGNVTYTSYDAHDRPVNVTDPNGGTTAYVYDGYGELIQQVSPVTGTTVYRYDLAGDLTQRVDARGVVTNYSYDALNRKTGDTYPGNASENVTYVYDEPSGIFGIGRLTRINDTLGMLYRHYDERGDIIAEIRMIGNVLFQTGYSFDAAQRISGYVNSPGLGTLYSRDVMGRITGVSVYASSAATTLTPVVSGITYAPFGPITAMIYGNGIKESRAYDPDYRLATLTDTGNTPVQSLFYSYDQANNVLGIRDTVKAGNSQTFGYDALNRLNLAAGAYGNLAYGYDALGNRLTDTATPPAASPDGLGSISAISYNQAGRVSTVTAGTQQIAAYGYDAFGQRLSRTATSSALYNYDQIGHLIEETDGQGNLQANYVYLGDQPIASVAPNTAGSGIGTVYFLHDDRLGTPQAATDAKQTLMWQASYQPFGTTSTGIGLITQDLRLPGQEFDSVTGWNHNGFREYVPGLGRYSQSDPTGLFGGINTYVYAGDVPLTATDRMGLDFVGFGLSKLGEKGEEVVFSQGLEDIGVPQNVSEPTAKICLTAFKYFKEAEKASLKGLLFNEAASIAIDLSQKRVLESPEAKSVENSLLRTIQEMRGSGSDALQRMINSISGGLLTTINNALSPNNQ